MLHLQRRFFWLLSKKPETSLNSIAHCSALKSFAPSVRDLPKPLEKINVLPQYSFSHEENEIIQKLVEKNKVVASLKSSQKKSLLKLWKNYDGKESAVCRLFPEHWKPSSLLEIPKVGPVKHLTVAIRKKGGRNNTGRITCRHRGGGHKQRARLLDLHKEWTNSHKVVRIEYDPTRTARIALLKDLKSKELKYVVATESMKPGFVIDPKIFNEGVSKPLSDIPTGTAVNNIERYVGKGGVLVRSAGTFATVVSFDGPFCTIKMPSGKLKKISSKCKATVGKIGNSNWIFEDYGNAGARRRRGWRPSVRGVAMNAVDHPHGGGKGGKSKGHHSRSIWGWPCK